MTEQRVIDTNLVIRYLVQDHPVYAKAANSLFSACDAGKVTLIILPEVLAECVFVLESFYGHSRRMIAQTLSALIESPGIICVDVPLHVLALQRYSQSTLHFVDCLVASYGVQKDIPIASFDKGFRKFKDVHLKNDV